MNIALNLKFKKLDDLCDQIFDYFHLVYYDLETKIDNELNINPQFDLKYVFLDDEERKRFAKFDHEYLIERPKQIEKIEGLL